MMSSAILMLADNTSIAGDGDIQKQKKQKRTLSTSSIQLL